jgi:hypothetical protein
MRHEKPLKHGAYHIKSIVYLSLQLKTRIDAPHPHHPWPIISLHHGKILLRLLKHKL